MLILIKVCLIYGALLGMLWLLCLFLYNYLYTEIPTGLAWRMPLAAAIIVFSCLLIPLVLEMWTGQKVPITLGQIFMDTTPDATLEFERLVLDEGGRQVTYRREGAGLGPNSFLTSGRKRFPPEVPEFLAITKDNRHIRFQALRDKGGHFVRRGGSVVYLSEEGYRMESGQLGRVELSQRGARLVTMFVLLLSVGSWIGGFLLARFNFGHAVGLGIGLYITWLFALGFIL